MNRTVGCTWYCSRCLITNPTTCKWHRRFIMVRSSSKVADSVNISKERLDSLTKLFVDDIGEIISNGVHEWLRDKGLLLAKLLLNAEVIERVGERNEHNKDRDCVRWGKQDGSVFLLE